MGNGQWAMGNGQWAMGNGQWAMKFANYKTYKITMHMKCYKAVILLLLISTGLQAQASRWQQKAKYVMNIDFDVKKHQFKGTQTLTYFNNSEDTLNQVFYHLYFNAFQPNSMMDVRSRNLPDSDPRVGKRIAELGKDEIGYHKIQSLKQNGQDVKYEVVGTILEVQLNTGILPATSATFEMEFESQVPVQIRRSGRDNAEGIAYSMAQWYPKMAEYDYQGWHANPYIAREFYGIWGDFDVTINMDKDYTIGATGYLQNPNEIGHGYFSNNIKPKGKKLSWHFKAPNVHDFVWAADPDYTHTTLTRKTGNVMHFFYEKNEETTDVWEQLPAIMDEAFEFINDNYGPYPYRQYSFIQGGDGGMEYPMATLITGKRSLSSLVGVSVHELLHSWYQMLLGTNESLYAWMDEGFTSWASSEVMNHLRKKGLIPGNVSEDPHLNSYGGYINFSKSGMDEPLSTHSDHFKTNSAYGVAAYVKGHIFLSQLEYVIGEKAFRSGMKRYFHTWKFKHPNVNDFIRVMEKESGLELDWYKEYFVFSTHLPEYGISGVKASDNGKTTIIELSRNGLMPMPVDVKVTDADGNAYYYTIPLRIMRGHKALENNDIKMELLEDWPWTHPTYEMECPLPKDKIHSIIIDPSNRLVDLSRDNNVYEQ